MSLFRSGDKDIVNIHVNANGILILTYQERFSPAQGVKVVHVVFVADMFAQLVFASANDFISLHDSRPILQRKPERDNSSRMLWWTVPQYGIVL